MRSGTLPPTMPAMEITSPTARTAGRDRVREDDARMVASAAVASVAGPTMSAAAAVLLRALGDASAMTLICPPQEDRR
ncbi:MAG: hypothetical protein QOI64_1208 [Solirubrobacteraceae bacterium]|jgi:hypothetical protein|nr:hypothetical protein [Solirubrobacteraceae bacterium]